MSVCTSVLSVIIATIKRIILFSFHSLRIPLSKHNNKNAPKSKSHSWLYHEKKYIQPNNAWNLSYLMSKVCNNERTKKTTPQSTQLRNDCRWLLNIIIIRILMGFKACTGNESFFLLFTDTFIIHLSAHMKFPLLRDRNLPGLPLPQSQAANRSRFGCRKLDILKYSLWPLFSLCLFSPTTSSL